MSDIHNLNTISQMSLWKSSDIEINPVSGGITNQNYIVTDGSAKYFVRIGADIPEHGVMRFNELAASRAAHAAGISPKVIHAETGIMVLEYIESKALSPEEIRSPEFLPEIISLVQSCHQNIPKLLRGAPLVFWVFQVLRDYSHTLNEASSHWCDSLPALMSKATKLEEDVGKIELVFGHNDLLCGNFINDGKRLWLIDWDYAGFNSPLFDLGGLASNNHFSAEQEDDLLKSYFGHAPNKNLMKQYSAMKCASLLRETMWSMVSEIHSNIDFDYLSYSKDNIELFDQAWEDHTALLTSNSSRSSR